MSKKSKPVFKKPHKKQSAEDVANELADSMIAEINRHRAEQGLPPLPDDHKD